MCETLSAAAMIFAIFAGLGVFVAGLGLASYLEGKSRDEPR